MQCHLWKMPVKNSYRQSILISAGDNGLFLGMDSYGENQIAPEVSGLKLTIK